MSTTEHPAPEPRAKDAHAGGHVPDPWGALRSLRNRALVAATVDDEPINGADAVDELVAIREELDAILAQHAQIAPLFRRLQRALREHDEASWDYAESPDGGDDASDAYDRCQRADATLDAVLDEIRVVAGAPKRRRKKV